MSELTLRKEIDNAEEQNLLMYSIVNTQYLKTIKPMVRAEAFYLPLSRRLWGWICEFHEKHGSAPGRHIQDIFNVQRKRLDSYEAEAIEMMLVTLNDLYDETFNEGYIIDQAERYLRARAIDVHIEQVQSLRNLDQIDEAEHEIATFNRASRVTMESVAINPHDEAFIRKAFEHEERGRLFKFPGALGDLLGWWCRERCYVCQARYKIGKTTMLQAIRLTALRHRLRVLDINHEMTEEELAMRHYRGLVGLPMEAGTFKIPVFDCGQNQVGSCKLSQRTNDVRLFNPEDGERKPPYRKAPKGYKPCDYCRTRPELRDNFVQDHWFTTAKREGLTPEKVIKRAQNISKYIGDRIRFKAFPRGTANIVRDVTRTFEILADQGFVADVCLDDYAEIHAAEDTERAAKDEAKLNDTLLASCGFASKNHLLYGTAAQIKTAALKKKSTSMGDASQSARAIYAHPSQVFSINQTEEEEELGLKRINVVADRFQRFNPLREVFILQQLELGQGILDSDWVERQGSD